MALALLRRGQPTCADEEQQRSPSAGCKAPVAFLAPAPTLPRLLGDLRASFPTGAKIGLGTPAFVRLDNRVRSLIKAYSTLNRSGDWRSCAAWGDVSYLRHLVYSDDELEVMVICWKEGQVSRIHNHADSHCWLTVLDGELREVQYSNARNGDAAGGKEGAEAGAAAPVPIRTTDLPAGGVAYINDQLALHSLGCYSRGHGPTMFAASLHVYSPPIRRVRTFENGQMSESIPGFFSRHVIAGAGAAA